MRICSITPVAGAIELRVYEVDHSAAALKPKIAGLADRLRSSSALEINMKLSEGILPRAFHVEIAGRLIPSRSATAEVPPSASMTSSTEISMTKDSSHGENLSRFLFQVIDGDKKTNNNNGMDSDEVIGNRLRLWALAEKLKPKDIYPRIGCSKGNWSEIISGKRHVSEDVADRLRTEFSITLEYLYYGQIHASFPVEITVRMEKIKADEANGIFIGRRRSDRMRQSAKNVDADGRKAPKSRTASG